ncbi:alpha/beta-hydrolase [Aspergillus steynii IBT 23096]|uniref:Alpha/beta-hydrolase n=1 Tax=Aspergillus steynii IBT 23096 TaxID=1392250 RepID=A0A2I2FXG3_9EURO|nr:alpha/beta-hydrolase [Aspergillus steynii IBT 23096]PLB45330.1 alpha/beta-hydrolase [Aspergillus steynii IBT 23096]
MPIKVWRKPRVHALIHPASLYCSTVHRHCHCIAALIFGMTSNAPSRCCTVGFLHEGEARGEIRDIGHISAYFAYPPNLSTQNAILILTDVIGHRLINAQLIADQFAAQGYFAVMPDLFAGDSVPINRPAGFNIMDWVQNHLPPQTEPIIETVLDEMRGKLGCRRVGGVGYCFGGKYVCRYLKPGRLDVGFIAHPTMVEPDELRGIEGPLSIAAAVRDFVFTPAKRHESEEILDGLEVPYQINTFSHVEHGFAVRCDISQCRQKYAKEQAFSQAVSWFNKYLVE